MSALLRRALATLAAQQPGDAPEPQQRLQLQLRVVQGLIDEVAALDGRVDTLAAAAARRGDVAARLREARRRTTAEAVVQGMSSTGAVPDSSSADDDADVGDMTLSAPGPAWSSNWGADGPARAHAPERSTEEAQAIASSNMHVRVDPTLVGDTLSSFVWQWDLSVKQSEPRSATVNSDKNTLTSSISTGSRIENGVHIPIFDQPAPTSQSLGEQNEDTVWEDSETVWEDDSNDLLNIYYPS
jgi:hypothetical protein